VYFDGTGDFLSISMSDTLASDFTIEFWQKDAGSAAYGTFFNTVETSTVNGLRVITGVGDNKIVAGGENSAFITASSAYTNNVWNHVALVRSGSTLTLYRNGSSVGSTTKTTAFALSTFLIGAWSSVAGAPFYGWISNMRVVKGSAVYTGSFTPSTSPLTAISGTQLLTCQHAEEIIDISSNNFTVTRYGNAISSPSSPF
jgi:hypothetical protein